MLSICTPYFAGIGEISLGSDRNRSDNGYSDAVLANQSLAWLTTTRWSLQMVGLNFKINMQNGFYKMKKKKEKQKREKTTQTHESRICKKLNSLFICNVRRQPKLVTLIHISMPPMLSVDSCCYWSISIIFVCNFFVCLQQKRQPTAVVVIYTVAICCRCVCVHQNKSQDVRYKSGVIVQ